MPGKTACCSEGREMSPRPLLVKQCRHHLGQHPIIPCHHITVTLSVSMVLHVGEGGRGDAGHFICQRAGLRKKGRIVAQPPQPHTSVGQ